MKMNEIYCDPIISQYCRSNNWQKLEKLIKKGTDLYAQNAFSETPLFIAVQSGSLECVKILIEAGVDPNIPNIFKEYPITEAYFNGRLDIEKYLFEVDTSVDLKNSFHKSYQDYLNEYPQGPSTRYFKINKIMNLIKSKEKS